VVGRDLRTPALRAAWTETLRRLLPPAPASVLDAGAGTGFLALIAAELGHQVTALDSSSGSLGVLRRKASERGVSLHVVEADVASPPPGPFDAVIERNVLWALPDAARALEAWLAVARPGGVLLAFEGAWGTGGGAAGNLRGRASRRSRRWRGAQAPGRPSIPEQVRATLPHGSGIRPKQARALVADASWAGPRVQRLRRVEWSERRAGRPVDWVLGVTPRYVVIARSGGPETRAARG
jgi:SAM-dependent methyltransferase